ncbi:MAG: hypothetical protein C5B49_14425 [Bdellovibrio sp.]|nr:MAG: hypothetical protein C5B49_14425 [Bdellovibrio sp.]
MESRESSRVRIQKGKAECGQVILENILLMVVLLGVASVLVKSLIGAEAATQFTEGPWDMLNGMIQCGVWKPCGIGQPAPALHPNSGNRILSYDPFTEGQ